MSYRHWTVLLLAGVFCPALPITSSRPVRGDEPRPASVVKAGIAVLPAEIRLSTTEARQRIVVQNVRDGRTLTQIWDDVELTSSDPGVVVIEEGMAKPVANGTASIVARWHDHTASAAVTVTGQDQPFQWSFRNHVESVLSKTGCNGGACHGARAGQKGFRLTLFGFDLAADHSYLTRQARGRRVIPTDPGRSLILTKPTGMIPHKGGVRFEVGSLEYRVLAEWIAAGAPAADAEDPVIQRLEVLPQYSRQQPGVKQQLVVLAHFSDGHVEDVTRWAKYTSVNSSVAAVGTHGLVEVLGSGEGAIKVWYLNDNQLAFLSVPYVNQLSPEVFAAAERRNFIDELVLKKLEALNLPASPTCDDSTFIRRLYLDATGTLPTSEETRQFLADPSPEKRVALIDRVLASPACVDYWAYKWSDLLLVSSKQLPADAVQTYYTWVRERVAQNMPWDELARQVTTATGSTTQNGATNFYALHESPEEMAETISQAFLGLSINCAKCHNHPLEKWTNDQYYGMANLFARVRGKGARVVFSETRGELIQPGTGRPQPPRPLDAEPVPFEDEQDRRIALAQWLTAPENPYFARAIANRVWANFLGVGLVERVDDLRVTNPASHEELLNAVANYLVEQKFDLRQLMRAILNSATYQRSSQSVAGNEPDGRFYSRYFPRRMRAEVLLDAIAQVTGVPSEFKDKPKGTRALQLADSNIESYFLSAFGRPQRVITCECERTDEPSITQVFHLYNGGTLNGKLQAKDNSIDQLLAAGLSDERLIEEVYLAALSRVPADSEKRDLLAILMQSQGAEKRLAIEDLYWGILSSREFLFNH